MQIPGALADLLAVPAVSGYEVPLADLVCEQIEGFGLHARRDSMDNVWTVIGSGRPRVVIFAHLDEIGFVITRLEDCGLIRARALGSWDPYVSQGVPVEIVTGNGVVAGVSVPTPPEAADPASLTIDVAARSHRDLTDMGLEVLQPLTMTRVPPMCPGNLVVSRALDNRITCYLLLELARSLAPDAGAREGELVLAFTSQEEVGFRGTRGFAREFRSLPIDACFSVDAYPAMREPGSAALGGPVLGAGPILRRADLEGVGSQRIAHALKRVAHSLSIPIQEAHAQGHNQASVLADSPWCALDFAMASLHSAVEAIDQRDLEQMHNLLHGIAESMELFGREEKAT